MTTRRFSTLTSGDDRKGEGGCSDVQPKGGDKQHRQKKAARIVGWSSTTQTSPIRSYSPRGSSGAFPLPPELWDHVSSFFRLQDLPLATLIDLMAINACTRLRELDLSGRRIGPAGARALADRIRARACPDLEEVGPKVPFRYVAI